MASLTQYNTLFLCIFVICMLVLVVLWIQSGIDKIVDFQGNLDWLTKHFSKSFLRDMVPFLLITLTILELGSGLLAFLGILEVVIFKTWRLPVWACSMSLFTFLSLFSAQRFAKDYAGAASLMGYFVFTIFLFFITFTASYIMQMQKLVESIKSPYSYPY